MLETNMTYVNHIQDILVNGHSCTCRGHDIIEQLAKTIMIDMTFPLVTLVGRKLSRKFAMGEAGWILSGSNRVADIGYCNNKIANFSDDGHFFFGAYGPKIIEQLPYIIQAFKKDLHTRQAVLTIWRERPYDTKDVPCTLSLQWLCRDGQLNCVATMRSSDAWLGLPYDLFNFSMVSAGVALLLRDVLDINVRLGKLYLTAGSSHLYCHKESFGYDKSDVYNLLGDDREADYAPLCLNQFLKYDSLQAYLIGLSHGTTPTVLAYDKGICRVDDGLFLYELFC
jgi:thymidylate synthase